MHQAVSRSFAYVAIIALIAVALFIAAMDILKYGFGIDPVPNDRDRMKPPKRRMKSRVAVRFTYVHSPLSL